MRKSIRTILIAGVLFCFIGCNNADNSKGSGTDQDYDTTGHSHMEGADKETFSIAKLVEEVTHVPDSIMEYLHAQHHAHKVLMRRTVPPGYETKNLKNWKDHIAKVEDLPVINPGPGEYVHVMEGHKHGYKNLVIGITETYPGGAPPMHTHKGEEAHVLLEGDVLYALGDTIFTLSAPYIVNIPPMVPHAFKNIGDKTANLVVIFPTNVWEYDVLDYFPFEGYDKDGKKIE
ncbi:MAG: cupin domain-containing protein [Pricia sp.]|nr:cupin domain-containing protein [Pricia sp.]